MSEKLQEQAARGAEAEKLLSHPLIKEFFDKAEQMAVDIWKTSAHDDFDLQKTAKAILRAQENLRQQFEVCIRNGEMSARELQKANDPTKPIRR